MCTVFESLSKWIYIYVYFYKKKSIENVVLYATAVVMVMVCVCMYLCVRLSNITNCRQIKGEKTTIIFSNDVTFFFHFISLLHVCLLSKKKQFRSDFSGQKKNLCAKA